MSIIYSYPEQGATVNPNDMLIGTSATKVGGKQKNLTKNFTVQQIADFINNGTSFIDPVASDFQIAVFNQSGLKITGSIMSQDAFPNGTGITVSGNLTTTGDLTASGNISLGGGSPSATISLLSETTLTGPIKDTRGILSIGNQILLSNNNSQLIWQDYEAGLTYQGTWNALNNTTNGLANSPALASNIGTNGHFYIVNIAGGTNLNGITDWKIGDWAVFVESGTIDTWQKIDNSSVFTGEGTDNKIAMWTGGVNPSTSLTDSLISQNSPATTVTVTGALTTTGNISTSGSVTATANVSGVNLNASGNVVATGNVSGVNVTATGNVSGVNVTASGNVSAVNVTASGNVSAVNVTATGTVTPKTITDKDAGVGAAGQILSSTVTGVEWIDNQAGTVTGTGTTNTLPVFTDGANGIIGDSIVSETTGSLPSIQVAGDFNSYRRRNYINSIS